MVNKKYLDKQMTHLAVSPIYFPFGKPWQVLKNNICFSFISAKSKISVCTDSNNEMQAVMQPQHQL